MLLSQQRGAHLLPRAPFRPSAQPAILVLMAALLAQLGQLHRDLLVLAEQDSEQEVTGSALLTLDRILTEAKRRLPDESTVSSQVDDYISWETVVDKHAPPPRAADAALVVGQVAAALEFYEAQGRLSNDHTRP